MSTLSEPALIRRVHDRFGFGPAPGELVAAQQAGLQDTLTARWAQLARPAVEAPPTFDERLESLHQKGGHAGQAGPVDKTAKKARNVERQANTAILEKWWLDQLVTTKTQLPERLTWFWHGHFATSQQKVKLASFMLAQNSTFRRLGRVSFRPLAQALILDPAMLLWLDGPKNTAKAPNENLGREFMELFALGHGNFTEDDVKAASRALTGWKVQRVSGHNTARLAMRQHDDQPKTILGRTADYDVQSFVDLLCDQTKGHIFVLSRIWARLVSLTPTQRGRDGTLDRGLRHGRQHPGCAEGDRRRARLRRQCDQPGQAAGGVVGRHTSGLRRYTVGFESAGEQATAEPVPRDGPDPVLPAERWRLARR